MNVRKTWLSFMRKWGLKGIKYDSTWEKIQGHDKCCRGLSKKNKSVVELCMVNGQTGVEISFEFGGTLDSPECHKD